MFKKLILLLLIVAPISIFAQDKIAYINSNEIFSKMPELKDVETTLMTERETVQKQLTAIQSEYTTLVEKFQKDTTALNESIIKDREAQLSTLQQRYETYAQTSGKEISEYQQQLLAPVQQRLQKAIQKVGADKGYTYIIEAGALLYTSPSAANIGDLVKAELGIK